MIPSAGTIITDKERELVLEAVNTANDPKLWNQHILRFEKAFAEYVGSKYALAVSSGTAALHLSLLALGIGKGDEVILPDMTFVACANAIAYTGATPVFADIDPYTWTLDPNLPVTRRTKAIMPVWMYGNMGELHALKEYGIPIIEDACPAVGSFHWAKHAGTIGDIGCFSFQGAKILATGEGGMIVTDNEDLYKRAKKLHTHGKADGWNWDERGYMYRFSNIQAALGLGQLSHIDEMVRKKRVINKWYKEMLAHDFIMDEEGGGTVSNCWMTSIMVPDAKKLMMYLADHGIETRPFFPPISSLGIYKGKKNKNAYHVAEQGINLPSATYLTLPQVEYVCNKIRDYYA